MKATGEPRGGPYELRAHQREYDACVAEWVDSAEELFMLAPGTPPPLTANKVRGWTAEDDSPLLLWQEGRAEPVGYAELNPMPGDPPHLWIGHVIVPKPLRGLGIGLALVQRLVHRAFMIEHAQRLSLVVFPQNRPALNCYLKAGLISDGTQYKRFRHVEGRFRMLKMTITRGRFEQQIAHVPFAR